MPICSYRTKPRPGALVARCVLCVGAVLATGAEVPTVRIHDPYADAGPNWYQGQVHMHSTRHNYRIGPDTLRTKVEKYRDAGFDFVCVTDHNFEVAIDPPFTVLPTRDPEVEGIHFISGVEVGFILPIKEGESARAQHIGGVGMDWTVSKGDSLFRLAETDICTTQGAVDSIRSRHYAPGKEALPILNHPDMTAGLPTLFTPQDLLGLQGSVGIEVFNTKWARTADRKRSWQRHGAAHWDFLLQHGEGTQWGFATDDAHAYVVGNDFLGGWILVAAAELSTESLLDAVKAGQFVACVDFCEGATRDTTSAAFTELGVRGSTVVAASDRPTEFTWWTDYGNLIRTTRGALADTFRVEGWERWVRVRIRNDAGAAYSQPFRVHNPDRDEDRWQLRPERGTRLLLHMNEGTGPIVHDASGNGLDLLLSQPVILPKDEWESLEDIVAYRDSLWGGWVHNGLGTAPDETDLDRDNFGYALRGYGESLVGEIPVRKDSPLVFDGDCTIEWIATITRRTEREQPLIVNESVDEQGNHRGWRVVITEESAVSPYRIRIHAADDAELTVDVDFGERVGLGETHLMAVVIATDAEAGGGVVNAYVGGEAVWSDPQRPRIPREALSRRVADVGASFALFHDPDRGDANVYCNLRELRLTSTARSAADIRSDAARLELVND